MWQQLAMAGASALQNEQNRKNNLASSVISEKYSGWTGRGGDFRQQGNNQGVNTMIKGLASGIMADQQAIPTAEAAKSMDKAGGTTSMSQDYLAMPEGNKSSFAAVARQPATTMQPELQQPAQLPDFMQGENPWMTMAKMAAPKQNQGNVMWANMPGPQR